MLSPRSRFVILKRDNYACQLCGKTARDGAKLEVDHKLATTNGGTNNPENLWTLCFKCNRGKSNLFIQPVLPLEQLDNIRDLPKRGAVELPRLHGDLYNNFPRLLRAKGVSINKFAKETGMTYVTAFDFYHCKSVMISFDTLRKTCNYFGVTLGQVIYWIPGGDELA